MATHEPASILAFIGTYTTLETFVHGKAKGIVTLRLDMATGAFSEVAVTEGGINPSYLALHPSRRYLYAVNELYTEEGGGLSAFAINAETGALTLLNRQPSHGGAPCHIVVDNAGRYLLATNYQTGSVSVTPITEDGRLGAATEVIQHVGSSVNPHRQQGPHAHSINLDSTNRFALVCDFGMDKVLVYRYDAERGKLTPHDKPWAESRAGAGPRHLTIHPSGRWVYVINELDLTVDAFAFDGAAGTLRHVQRVPTVPDGVTGSRSTADIHCAPSGKFVYGSNRGHDSIAAFAVDQATGHLTPLGQTPTQGRTPRNFAIDRTGTWLFAANQDSDTIVTFRLDPQTGALDAAGPIASVPTPVCVCLLD